MNINKDQKKNKTKILFLGRKNDLFSLKISKLLKKKFNKVTSCFSKKHNEKPNRIINNWKGDYIISFRNYIILKDKHIKSAKKASINFHPGPPKYRGTGCLNYALFNNEKYYGITTHLMNGTVDSGKIIDIKKFRISPKDNLKKILYKTHQHSYKSCIKILNLIYLNELNLKKMIDKNKKYKWSKIIGTKKELDKFYVIKIGTNKKDLEKKIRATLIGSFKPYIKIFNKSFYLQNEK